MRTENSEAIQAYSAPYSISHKSDVRSLILTCPPEHGVVEEGELHLCVMLQRGPASRRRHIDVGDVERNLHRQEGLSRVPNLEGGGGGGPGKSALCRLTRAGSSGGDPHLKIGGDGTAADVDQLRHVVVGVEGPDAALQVEVLVELDALGLPHAGVELVGAVVARTQRDAVVGHVIQEARLCGGQSTLNVSTSKRDQRSKQGCSNRLF